MVRIRAIGNALFFGLVPSRFYEETCHHEGISYSRHLWMNLGVAARWAIGIETQEDKEFEATVNRPARRRRTQAANILFRRAPWTTHPRLARVMWRIARRISPGPVPSTTELSVLIDSATTQTRCHQERAESDLIQRYDHRILAAHRYPDPHGPASQGR